MPIYSGMTFLPRGYHDPKFSRIMHGKDCRPIGFARAEETDVTQFSKMYLVRAGKQPVDAIVVVDMQVGLLDGPPKHDLQGVIQRINLLTAVVRKQSGKVIWIVTAAKRATALSGNSRLVVSAELAGTATMS